MSRRAVLWIAFAVVHVGVAVLGFLLPNAPMGDVYLVYQPWVHQALSGHGIVGITEPWVYPQLALVPLLLAQALSTLTGSYIVAWAVLVTLCDAAAFALLVGRGRSTGRAVAAWFWLASAALLGPVGMYRLDGLTVPLALAGGLWLIGRPWLGSTLLAVGVWIKVWPAASVAAALIAVRRRMSVLGGAALVSVVVLAAVVVAGGGRFALGFVTEQTGRGLQIEAPVTALFLWPASLLVPGYSVFFSPAIHTFEVAGPGVDVVVAVMTPLLALAVLAMVVLGGVKAWRGASFVALFPPLSLALVTGFILFNKVGSPQYMTWIVAPLAFGLVLDRRSWWRPACVGLVMALVTQTIYPILYRGMMLVHPLPLPVALLTLRNGLVAVLFVWMVVRLARVRGRSTAAAPSHVAGMVTDRVRSVGEQG